MAETSSKIVRYIRDQLSAGYSEQQIRDSLLGQGWHAEEVEVAFSIARSAPRAVPPEKARQAAQAAQTGRPAKRVGTGFVLSVAGGSLIVLNSVLVFLGIGDMLELFVPGISISFLSMFGVALSAFDSILINILIGAFLIVASFIIYFIPGKARLTGMFMVALSVITVLVGNGFLIGGIIAMVGGVFAMLGR
jgi:hypothetical protein